MGGSRAQLRPPPGPTPKLTAEQREALQALLAQGAEAHGFIGEVWTTKRVAAVIEREFVVSYHPAHLGRLLRRERLSVQKPIRRATQSKEEEIAGWRAERWPALQAKREPRGGPSSS